MPLPLHFHVPICLQDSCLFPSMRVFGYASMSINSRRWRNRLETATRTLDALGQCVDNGHMRLIVHLSDVLRFWIGATVNYSRYPKTNDNLYINANTRARVLRCVLCVPYAGTIPCRPWQWRIVICGRGEAR